MRQTAQSLSIRTPNNWAKSGTSVAAMATPTADIP